jgi:hypothetical protein
MKRNLLWVARILAVLFFLSFSFSQTPPDKADTAAVNRIWEEGTTNSQVMQTLSYLSDVIGPRIPGSPAMKRACDWTALKLREWGLQDVAVESCGEIGLG